MCFKSWSNIWCCFYKDSQVHESRGRDKSNFIHFYFSDPLARILLSDSMTLFFSGLEILTPNERMLLGDTLIIPLNWKLRLPSNHFGLSFSLNQQTKFVVMDWLG